MEPNVASPPKALADEAPVEVDLFASVDLSAADAAPAGRAPELVIGSVRGAGSSLVVDLGRAEVHARRAKSCLVAPELGDRVLCARDGDRVFVLAVLEGAAGAPTRVVATGDMEVQAAGKLGLVAGDRVEVSAAREVSLTSGKLVLRAQAAVAAIEELGLRGGSLDAHLRKAVVVAERLETRAGRLVQRAKQVFRFVEGAEQVRAGVLDVRAESLAVIRGENTIVAARALAKLDGEQVKIG